ncbi:MAG TPA: AsmA-like C-terminal region-containing protein [Micropepsaceae bacterium]|nr:AsmA-like C-terminal region-containing protein [Micropepsaceae bacterium]
MLLRHVQRATLIVTAIIAAALFFAAGAALRLTMGPISLGAFSQPIADALNLSVTGATIRFDEAVLEWSRDDGRINLIVLGTKIFDRNGHIITQAPKADLNLDALALLSGRLRLKSFGLVGLQLTGVRTQDGAVRLGFGRDQSEANFLDTLRELLKSSAGSSAALDTLSLQHARVAFLDQPTGLFIVLPDANLSLTARKTGFDTALVAAGEITGSPFRIDAHARLRDDGMPLSANIKLAGFSLHSLTENNSRFAVLKPYELTTDVTADISFSGDGEPAAANFRAAGSGSVDVPAMGGDLRLSRFAVEGHVDPQSRHAEADNITIDGADLLHGRGAVSLDWDNSGISQLTANVDSGGIRLNLPKLYSYPLAFAHLAFHANYNRDDHSLSWDNGAFEAGPVSGNLRGSATVDASGVQGVRLLGGVAPVMLADLLTYWPNGIAESARDWIIANVPQGKVGPLQISAALPAGVLDAPSLPDSALTVTFPFQGLTTQYVDGMTPITRAEGEATLKGDSFDLVVNRGAIGPLALSRGEITIPNLHLSGSVAHIVAHADGATSDVLRLIDEKPLEYPKKFGILPASVEGRSSVDLDFELPLLRDLSWDQVHFQVKANAAQLALPIAERRIEGANVEFVVDPSSLKATGQGRYAAVPVNFTWTEDFAAIAKSTRLDVTGTADDAGRSRLGITTPDWITGPMPFALTLTGQHFRFTEGVVKADLTRVAADFPGLAAGKPAGIAASGTAQLSFDDDGVVSMPDFAAASSDLHLHGALLMAEEGRIRSLALSDFHAGSDDFAMTLIPSGHGYAITIQGQSLDVRHLTGLDRPGSPSPDRAATKVENPISISAQVQRLVLSNRATLRNVAMSIAFEANDRLNGFDLRADSPGVGKLSGHMTVVKGIRTLDVEADNAGALIDTVVNFPSIRGGKLNAQITFPEPGSVLRRVTAPLPDYEGTVTFSDVVLTNQPFIARLLAAGSLDGPLRLLQGEGIALSKVTLPFRARGRMIEVADGRASGDAIGGTFTGSYERDSRKMDISGTLVPLFGLNSVLGSLPLVGDLLVSKKGEGILGLTYEMKGNIGDPSITVNPLSMLTPGIFRRIFEFGPSRAGEAAAQRPQK